MLWHNWQDLFECMPHEHVKSRVECGHTVTDIFQTVLQVDCLLGCKIIVGIQLLRGADMVDANNFWMPRRDRHTS